MRLRREEERYAYGLITPSMVVVFGVIIVPIITTLVYTFVNINPLSSHRGEFAGFSFYIKALSSKAFWDDLGRTLYFTIASTAIETVFGLLIALLLNQTFPGVRLLRSIIIIAQIHYHYSVGNSDCGKRKPLEIDAKWRIWRN